MLPFKRSRLSTARREALYDQALACARIDDPAAEFPRCNICTFEIRTGQRWHASHMPAPYAITGAAPSGIAHDKCNLERARKHDVPLVADTKRLRARHIGAFVARHPMPGGRDDPRSRSMSGRLLDRRTGGPWRGWKQPSAPEAGQ
jgi:hypothetical protein